MSEQALDHREKIQALALAKDCYTTKLELLTNATVVDDAIRFVNTCSTTKEDINNRESNEQSEYTGNNVNEKSCPDEEGKQEDGSGVITSTHNQLF